MWRFSVARHRNALTGENVCFSTVWRFWPAQVWTRGADSALQAYALVHGYQEIGDILRTGCQYEWSRKRQGQGLEGKARGLA